MATYTVTNLTNGSDGDFADLSLYEAILLADGDGVADTIVFQDGLSGTITLGATSLTTTEDLTIVGPGADKLTLAKTNGAQILFAAGAATLEVSGLTFTGTGLTSGPIYTIGGMSLHLSGVAFKGGTSAAGTAGVFHNSTGSLVIENSTFSGNSALTAPVYVSQSAAVQIINSTIANNTSTGGSQGGAVHGSAGTLLIRDSTIAGNSNSATPATNGVRFGGMTVTVENSILYNPANGGADLNGTLANVTAKHSLFAADPVGLNGASADNLFGDPLLGALADNGGTVLTMLPGAGSPALNAGDNALGPPPALDARGLPRISGGAIDLGALEVQVAAVVAVPPAAGPPPSKAPAINADFSNLMRFGTYSREPLPATVTTPDGQVLPNPLLEQQKAVAALIAKVDAGALTLQAALDQIVDLADATSSVATMSYQFFTGHLPTREGLDYLVSSPQNPSDLNDGYYAGMSLENRYINFAVNLGKVGEGRAGFIANYGSLSLSDATAKAYLEIFGQTADASKLAAILTPERASYLLSLGGDALGQKAAMVGFLLGEAAKADLGPYAASNENFLYDLADGTAAFGANLHIYDNAGPHYVGLVGVA